MKDFLNRFGALMVKLHTEDEDMKVHAFSRGVLPRSFSDSLIRCHPKTFNEIRHRVVAHIVAEEEVTEMHRSIGLVRPRGTVRPQPLRVHEVATEKKTPGKQLHMTKRSLKPGHVRRRTPPPGTIFE